MTQRVKVQWACKDDKLDASDSKWHLYRLMTEQEAADFMRNEAPNSNFFKFRVVVSENETHA